MCVCSAGGCRLGIPPENTQINVDIQALLGAAGQHWPWWHFAEEKKVSGKAGFCLLSPCREMLLFVQQLEELPHIWSQGGERACLELCYCYQGLPFCGER